MRWKLGGKSDEDGGGIENDRNINEYGWKGNWWKGDEDYGRKEWNWINRRGGGGDGGGIEERWDDCLGDCDENKN